VWDSGFLRRLADPACDFRGNVLIVRGLAADQAAQRDDGVIFAGFSQRARL